MNALLRYLIQSFKYYKYLCIAVVICVAIALPSYGLGSDVVQDSLDSMKETEAWWSQLWQSTFQDSGTGVAGANQSGYMFSAVVHWFLALSLLFWVVRLLLQTGQIMSLTLPGVIQTIAPFMVSVMVVSTLLANNAALARAIPWAMRDNINAWRNGLMEAHITDLTVRGALTDVFKTKESSGRITAQAQMCAQMPQPATMLPSPTRPTDPVTLKALTLSQQQAYNYIDCMSKLKDIAQKEQANAQSAVCTDIPGVNQLCGGFVRFAQKTLNSLTTVQNNELKRIKQGDGTVAWDFTTLGTQMILDDFLGGVLATAGFKTILNAIQWVFISMMELGLWVDGLVAPIMIATALVPGQLNLVMAWAISFLTIGLSQLTYTAVIGAVALVLSKTTTYFASDLRFEMALGFFAPIVCTAVLTGGGIAASRAFTGQAIGLSTAAVSIASGVASSAFTAVGRLAYANR